MTNFDTAWRPASGHRFYGSTVPDPNRLGPQATAHSRRRDGKGGRLGKRTPFSWEKGGRARPGLRRGVVDGAVGVGVFAQGAGILQGSPRGAGLARCFFVSRQGTTTNLLGASAGGSGEMWPRLCAIEGGG